MTYKKPLTQALLKSTHHYNPETGIFTRTLKSGVVKVVGYYNSRGYIQITINGSKYLAHRLAWLYMASEWPEDCIDHINGIKDDNRISNLREATKSENLRNRGAQKNNKSGFKGVYRHKSNQKWASQITINGKQKTIGYFDNPEDAYQAYCKATEELHGEFANGGKI